MAYSLDLRAFALWKVLTVLAAISVAGVVAAASIYAATDTDVFVTFVREALVPALRPGQVVVMDNLASHHVAQVRELLEGAACRLVFLPPYSPDLSPIEPAWSKVKQCVRSRDPRDAGSLAQALQEGFASVTPGDCLGPTGGPQSTSLCRDGLPPLSSSAVV